MIGEMDGIVFNDRKEPFLNNAHYRVISKGDGRGNSDCFKTFTTPIDHRRVLSAQSTHEGRQMNKASPIQFAATLLILLAGLMSAAAHGQEKFTYNHAAPPDASKYIRDYSIEVDDVPGHKVRIVEIQRTYTKNHPTIMGAKVVETWFRGFTDYGARGGPGRGYETWILEDGSKVYLESVFLSTIEVTASGSRRGTSYATDRFVGGTGQYATIRGSVASITEFDTDPNTGYNRPSSRGEYWLANP